MLGTGIRVGETTGLRWYDIDLEGNMIEVNHTLVYYNHAENGCYFNVHTPKTEAGKRRIPMLQSVKEAFLEEKKYQEQFGLKCIAEIDGYMDVMKELARREFEDLDEKLKENMDSVKREQSNGDNNENG